MDRHWGNVLVTEGETAPAPARAVAPASPPAPPAPLRRLGGDVCRSLSSSTASQNADPRRATPLTLAVGDEASPEVSNADYGGGSAATSIGPNCWRETAMRLARTTSAPVPPPAPPMERALPRVRAAGSECGLGDGGDADDPSMRIAPAVLPPPAAPRGYAAATVAWAAAGNPAALSDASSVSLVASPQSDSVPASSSIRGETPDAYSGPPLSPASPGLRPAPLPHPAHSPSVDRRRRRAYSAAAVSLPFAAALNSASSSSSSVGGASDARGRWLTLTPIDHGLCLPAWRALQRRLEANRDSSESPFQLAWTDLPAVRQPPSPALVARVAARDAAADAVAAFDACPAARGACGVSWGALEACSLGCLLLQRSLSVGLSLGEVGDALTGKPTAAFSLRALLAAVAAAVPDCGHGDACPVDRDAVVRRMDGFVLAARPAIDAVIVARAGPESE